MMMFRVLITVLSLGFIAVAEASQVSQIELSEGAASQSLQMMDQKFEPIYEEQPYQDTCSRDVLDHMETVCSTTNDTVCHGSDGQVCETENDQVCNSRGCTTIPRRVCRQEQRVCEVVPRRSCSDHAVMRTEYFSCTKYRTVVVGHRLVKTFHHNIEVLVDRPELLQGQRLVISMLARESAITPTLVSSFALNVLTVESQRVSVSDQGASAILVTRILVHVGVSTSVVGKILTSSVQELKLYSSAVTLKLPGLAELAQSLMIRVSLSQHRDLWSDKGLFDGSLASASLAPVVEGDSLRITIPMSKMNLSSLKSNKRHNLKVSVSLVRPSLPILNENDLSALINKRLEAALSKLTPN